MGLSGFAISHPSRCSGRTRLSPSLIAPIACKGFRRMFQLRDQAQQPKPNNHKHAQAANYDKPN